MMTFIYLFFFYTFFKQLVVSESNTEISEWLYLD